MLLEVSFIKLSKTIQFYDNMPVILENASNFFVKNIVVLITFC